MPLVRSLGGGLAGRGGGGPCSASRDRAGPAGRAGRHALPGEVMVQTEFPDHAVFQALLANDYAGFADATFDIVKFLRGTLGVRITNEKRRREGCRKNCARLV